MLATTATGGVADRALTILTRVTGDRALLTDLDLPLYASGVLDSLGTVGLMAAFEVEFGLTISPADFDRDAWSTPRSLVADIERRLTGRRAAE
jgi:D-alanine--poly(phosphoribitol) ligase subunit 2